MRAIRRDMRDLRPSLVPAVPRVLNRMYAEATGTAARRLLGEAATRGHCTDLTLTSPVRWLTNRVLAARVEQLFRGTAASSKAGLGSRLLFSRIRRQMGGSELDIDIDGWMEASDGTR